MCLIGQLTGLIQLLNGQFGTDKQLAEPAEELHLKKNGVISNEKGQPVLQFHRYSLSICSYIPYNK